MGFYLRKSISVGPFRFNFSKSGIGISMGIKGLRFGTGPRGNYIHMGRGGLYYRATLPRGQANYQKINKPIEHQYKPKPIETPTHEPLEEIESGSIFEMVDSSSASLLEELNNKHKKMVLWPIPGLLGCLGIIGVFFAKMPHWTLIPLAIVTLLITIIVYYRDQVSKSVVMFYDLETDAESNYQLLYDAFDKMLSCYRVWHIEAQGKASDWKRQAGATSILQRNAISLAKGEPSYVKTNISVPLIPVGRQTLYFFPDRVLVFDKEGVGAISYKDIQIKISQTRFIEGEHVPGDAKVVGQTWKYVNKKGGPDRRFKDNRQIPIALYEDVHLTSNSGLNKLIQLSRLDCGEYFQKAIESYSKLSPN